MNDHNFENIVITKAKKYLYCCNPYIGRFLKTRDLMRAFPLFLNCFELDLEQANITWLMNPYANTKQ